MTEQSSHTHERGGIISNALHEAMLEHLQQQPNWQRVFEFGIQNGVDPLKSVQAISDYGMANGKTDETVVACLVRAYRDYEDLNNPDLPTWKRKDWSNTLKARAEMHDQLGDKEVSNAYAQALVLLDEIAPDTETAAAGSRREAMQRRITS